MLWGAAARGFFRRKLRGGGLVQKNAQQSASVTKRSGFRCFTRNNNPYCWWFRNPANHLGLKKNCFYPLRIHPRFDGRNIPPQYCRVNPLGHNLFLRDNYGINYQPQLVIAGFLNKEFWNLTIPLTFPTHTIHVWYIYLHLVDFHGKCTETYHTWVLWARHPSPWLGCWTTSEMHT